MVPSPCDHGIDEVIAHDVLEGELHGSAEGGAELVNGDADVRRACRQQG